MKEHAIDRTGWAPGPWDDEPNREQWQTKAGLPGLIVRGETTGALCGYVGVPPEHPYHSDPNYHAIEVDVHGGLTYAAPCAEDTPICHVPLPGEPDDVWWLGFDCGHYRDTMPAMQARERAHGWSTISSDATYKDIAYVRAEVEHLAEQLAAVPA